MLENQSANRSAMNDFGLSTEAATTDPRRRVRQRGRTIRGCASAALLCAGLWPGAWAEDAETDLSGAEGKINYSVGYEFGRYLDGLKLQGTGVELEVVFSGVRDALSGAEPRISHAEIQKELDALKGAAADRGKDSGSAQATARARVRGYVDDFAKLNAKREGVVTLPSGVQYEALKQGSGRKPGLSDKVAVNYEGRLASGVVFDTTSDDEEPTRLRIEEIVVPGLREVLVLMKEGDKWRVVIPPNMGFGATGNNLLRKRDLIYEVELISVEASP